MSLKVPSALRTAYSFFPVEDRITVRRPTFFFAAMVPPQWVRGGSPHSLRNHPRPGATKGSFGKETAFVNNDLLGSRVAHQLLRSRNGSFRSNPFLGKETGHGFQSSKSRRSQERQESPKGLCLAAQSRQGSQARSAPHDFTYQAWAELIEVRVPQRAQR